MGARVALGGVSRVADARMTMSGDSDDAASLQDNSSGVGAGDGPSGGANAAERTIRILAFGDSLTQGYGVPPGMDFPNVLERALKARGST